MVPGVGELWPLAKLAMMKRTRVVLLAALCAACLVAGMIGQLARIVLLKRHDVRLLTLAAP